MVCAKVYTNLCWVEGLVVLRLRVGPAQGAEGPQTGRKPGVEHILVLTQHHVLFER